MTRISKKNVFEYADNTSPGRNTRQRHLSRQKDASEESEVRKPSREQPSSLNQAIIFHFFHPLEVDTKKTSSAGMSRVVNSTLSSKGKVALRKHRSKKSKAKQLEEIQKYNKTIPMFFDYINPEKAKEIKEIESNINREKTQTKSTRSFKKNNDELLRNQRQLTEFYTLIEQISELSFSNKSESMRNNDGSRANSKIEDDNASEDNLRCLNTVKKDERKNRETQEIPRLKNFFDKNSISFDNNMDCDSSLAPRFSSRNSRLNSLSYHLSNFSVEPNDSFITISPKVAPITPQIGLEAEKMSAQRTIDSEDVENLLETMRDSSPQPVNSLNSDEESLCNNMKQSCLNNSQSHTEPYSNSVTDQVERLHSSNYVEESQARDYSSNILSFHIEKSHRNNITNKNEYLKQDTSSHSEKSLIEKEKMDIIEDKMIIGCEMNGFIDQGNDRRNDSIGNGDDDGQSDFNCEVADENLTVKILPKKKDQYDSYNCYSWEDEIIDFHTNGETSMIHTEQLEKRDPIKEKNLNENMSYGAQELLKNGKRMVEKTNVNEKTLKKKGQHILIDDKSSIDFHCCSQSKNKCGFHHIHDLLLDKENYNQDSNTFESFDDPPILDEFNDISSQKKLICSPHSYGRFLKDGVSPSPSPPSSLSQTTLAMIPRSAWDALPSFNVSTLDSEVFNDDL